MLFLRLFRFILRFIAVMYLMTCAVFAWLCRKRVKKGRPIVAKEEPANQMFDIMNNPDYDGIPLMKIEKSNNKKED